MKNFTLKDLPLAERPRERLATFGAHTLSAQELLAILLGRGTAGRSVMVIAQDLLARFGSLSGVVEASLHDLQQIAGLGQAKATQLKACLEIARRVRTEESKDEATQTKAKSIASPEDIANMIRDYHRDWHKEHIWLISFDNRNKKIGIDLVGIGTLNSALLQPREIYAMSLQRHASSIAIVHNHPSGDCLPSKADIESTQRLHEASGIMGINLLDHVIITKTTHYSFREKGLL